MLAIKAQRGASSKNHSNAIQQNVFKAGMIDRRGFELMQEVFYGLGSATGSQIVVATAKVTTDELTNYLCDTVKSLTDGNQVPRFCEKNLDNHFVVWDYRK